MFSLFTGMSKCCLPPQLPKEVKEVEREIMKIGATIGEITGQVPRGTGKLLEALNEMEDSGYKPPVLY